MKVMVASRTNLQSHSPFIDFPLSPPGTMPIASFNPVASVISSLRRPPFHLSAHKPPGPQVERMPYWLAPLHQRSKPDISAPRNIAQCDYRMLIRPLTLLQCPPRCGLLVSIIGQHPGITPGFLSQSIQVFLMPARFWKATADSADTQGFCKAVPS